MPGISSAENSTSSSTSQSASRGPTVVQRNFKCCPVPVPPPKKKVQPPSGQSESSDSSPALSTYSPSCPSQPDSDIDLPSKLLICESLDGRSEEFAVRDGAATATQTVFHDSLIPEIKPVVSMGEKNEKFAKKKVF